MIKRVIYPLTHPAGKQDEWQQRCTAADEELNKWLLAGYTKFAEHPYVSNYGHRLLIILYKPGKGGKAGS